MSFPPGPDSSGAGGGDDTAALFIEDEPDAGPARGRRRGAVVALVCVLCAAAVGLPVAYLISSGGSSPAHHGQSDAAKETVISALSATNDSGSFNMTFTFSGLTAPTVPTTSTTCPNPMSAGVATLEPATDPSVGSPVNCFTVGGSEEGLSSQPISGQGTIDTDPYAMVTTSNVPGVGTVTLRANDTDVWELGGGDYGLSPGSQTSGPGSPLSGFAQSVEGTLGPRDGGLAMLGLASPTGYLNLEQQVVTGATFVGTGTVDGVSVNRYQVFINPSEEATLPGLTSEQSSTISAALALLARNGYVGTSTLISIDASGYIRETVSTSKFSDGSSATRQSILSDFGCAGTVLMPGQPGSSAPPAGCVSPDTGVAPTTTTSSSVPPAGNAPVAPTTVTAPAGQAPTTSTTLSSPSSTTTTTSSPGSTTTTPSSETGSATTPTT